MIKTRSSHYKHKGFSAFFVIQFLYYAAFRDFIMVRAQFKNPRTQEYLAW